MAKLPVTVKSEKPANKVAESTKAQGTISPSVDIYETKGALVMVVDMPGTSKDDIELKIDNGVIMITGRSKVPKEGDLIYWEFCPCNYSRVFELSPEIDQEKIEAEYKHGVLTVHLPKLERAKPRQITVNVK